MQRPRSSWIRRVRRLLPALVLLVPACDFHCGSGAAKKKAPTTYVSDAGAGRVEVVRNGGEPRVQLSVARWKGLEYQVQLTTSGSFGVQGRPPIRPPASVADLSFEVVRGTADPVIKNGQRLVEEHAVFNSLRVTGGGLPPELAKKANEALSVIDGTTIRQFVASDGELADVKTELVGGAKPSPEVKKTLDQVWDSQRQFPFRLPPVPVGVGASWRFSEPTEVRGVRAMQIADMTIIGMDDKNVRIRIRVRQQAPRQELDNPLDPSSTAILEHYRGDGQGELTIDRMTAVTRRARLTITASLELSALDEQGNKKRVTFIAATVMQVRGSLGAPEGGAGGDGGGDAAVDAAPAPKASGSAGGPAP